MRIAVVADEPSAWGPLRERLAADLELVAAPPGGVAPLPPGAPGAERSDPAGDEESGPAIAAALRELEPALAETEADAVLIGCTGPAAVAAALVAAKLELPAARLRAGERPGGAPEVDALAGGAADRLAALLLCAGEPELEALRAEGLADHAIAVGDPVADPEPAASAIRDWLGARRSPS